MSEIQIAPPYRLVQTRHGPMLVNPNDVFMGQSFLRYGESCQHEIQVLLQLISHPQALPGIVVEVGSNMGVHTVPLARELARQNRSLLAFEPQPVIFQQLCANLALNGLMNVTALPYACGAESGLVSFETPGYRTPGNFGGTAMAPAGESASLTGSLARQTVPCHPLDGLIRDIPVALLKIDAEGYELRVLQGARSLLAGSSPILYVENDRIQQSPQLIEWLLAHGYRLWWHITQAFNPANFLHQERNIYGDLCLINMLGVHRSRHIVLQGLPEIVDPNHHPLKAAPAIADAVQMPEPRDTPCAAPG